MLFSSTKKQERNTTELQNAIEVIARSQADVLDRMEDFSTQQALDALTQQLSTLTQDYSALKTQLEQQPEHFTTRPPSTGNNPTANTVDY
ncbi:GPO family capsid scaffolding protein, partial [Serratia bockelmannii]|uniref:GPO family capsid scaffolding protein n=1 Tax=Serratia bockelmannii TaxID=2703793 RepID=UPI003FA6C408